MKIKKGKLNYDQSGRAYPDNPRLKENWDSIWEYEGKYYKLVGDNEHKEWDEVNIYNQIIDEAYESYLEKMVYHPEENWLDDENGKKTYRQLTQEEFIDKCKTNPEFSEKWGLKIEEREVLAQIDQTNPILKGSTALYPHKLITITYNNETIESYE